MYWFRGWMMAFFEDISEGGFFVMSYSGVRGNEVGDRAVCQRTWEGYVVEAE